MTTLNQALLQLAADLKDDAPGNEFIAYPRELLLQWWNDGVCLLATFRPDLFSETKVVTLQPGSRQEVEGCDVIGKVLGQVNPDGTVTPIRRSDFNTTLAWTKRGCPLPAAKYTITSYRFDQTQKDVFYIEPPIPPGKEVKVELTCSGSPEPLSIENLDEEVDLACYQFAMTKHYVLSMAYSQDTDQTNLALAQFHMGLWNGFLGLGARASTAFASGSATAASAVPQAAGGTR